MFNATDDIASLRQRKAALRRTYRPSKRVLYRKQLVALGEAKGNGMKPPLYLTETDQVREARLQ